MIQTNLFYGLGHDIRIGLFHLSGACRKRNWKISRIAGQREGSQNLPDDNWRCFEARSRWGALSLIFYSSGVGWHQRFVNNFLLNIQKTVL